MNAEPKTDAHTKPAAADSGLTKFDPAALKGIGSTAMVSSNGSAFLPASMAEAMELGKLMCLSNFVPPHLRGKPGDCLAVVMQATRWGMDPFAVANKTYFVNDRMAYEAQLVNAVLNSRAPLEGRLRVEWDGDGNLLTCKVTGKIKGDPVEHSVWQELALLTTKNSPLWKTSPRQQLAYYTTRMWARLYCPEVLLGVYTDEEIEDMGPLAEQPDGSYAQEVIPPRPTRQSTAAAEEAARKGSHDMDRQYRQTMGQSVDDETGEVLETEQTRPQPAPAPETKPFNPKAASDMLMKKVLGADSVGKLNAIEIDYAAELNALETADKGLYDKVQGSIDAKRDALGKK